MCDVQYIRTCNMPGCSSCPIISLFVGTRQLVQFADSSSCQITCAVQNVCCYASTVVLRYIHNMVFNAHSYVLQLVEVMPFNLSLLEGSDFVFPEVVFHPYQRSVTVNVLIIDDEISEELDNFTIAMRVSPDLGGSINATGSIYIEIIDDDCELEKLQNIHVKLESCEYDMKIEMIHTHARTHARTHTHTHTLGVVIVYHLPTNSLSRILHIPSHNCW